MAWTPEDLKAAVAALDPAPADDEAAAAAINTQTTTLPPRNVLTEDARTILLLDGELFGISRLADEALNGTADHDGAVIAAFACWQTIGPSSKTEAIPTVDPAQWAAVQTMLTSLHAAGKLSDASLGALLALRTPTVPTWQPAVTADDIARARSA